MNGKIKSTQIGRCGELLVQQRLLFYGIESSSLTTDSGIDLVAYSVSKKAAFTIQVKSNFQPKKGGGKGPLNLGFDFPKNPTADILAFVDLSRNKVWLMPYRDAVACARQNSKGKVKFYFYKDFEQFLLEKQIKVLF